MDVAQLAFNQLIGLEAATEGSGFLVSLPNHPRYANHIGSVHAGALMTLAESASGVFLSRNFADFSGYVPVVRRFEAKFRKPAGGTVSARCPVTAEQLQEWREGLRQRGRLLLVLPVEVVDGAGELAMTAKVEWFIARQAV